MAGKEKTPIILEDRITAELNIDPLTEKHFLKLVEPDLSDNRGDVDRVRDALSGKYGPIAVPRDIMNGVSLACRQGNWEVTATVGSLQNGFGLVDIQPGDTSSLHLGAAVDIGTTTVVAYLVDMSTGRILNTAADYNGQIKFGEDILTRIYLAGEPDGLEALRQSVLQTLNGIFFRLTEGVAFKPRDISAAAIGANSTMIHLLLGLDPSRICLAPYISVVNAPGVLGAAEIGLEINPLAPVYCLPGVGSYVGGDVLGGVLVSNMYRNDELAFLVDIGTNGEMVLGNRDWLVACAGAAGPALEGGVVRSGMRAEPGAIWQVRIDQQTRGVEYRTIGDLPPVGICGSGLIDCLAEMFLCGIIDRAGKFKGGLEQFVVVPAAETPAGEDIVVTQTDINNLMRTKGAVNAALELLLESVGCGLEQIERFYAAGAFGQYLDLESSITIGLYPDLPREKMVRLGNSSGEGARQVLLSSEKRKDIETIAKNITYFELNANQTFMNKFVSSKFLPHTNMDYFPTVKARLAARGMLK
ncbi:electron transfer protein [Desulfocucumis palustris]|uniref:Electron transfer protein n=1 Tax=Desulfocucumis palustris TaxID=1898651 RepID=A0A2L2XFG7_9FIRM|nr:ASKHA domain-containing protein [Desulfocucumis palustris]GBF34988.1 electron transfer protein [Desulfocucumis palustris]